MHIPDGYLSPQTSLPLLGAMVPLWSLAVGKIKKVLNLRQIPVLSLCAAFSFVIMMFNIPLGASSVHAVGAVFIAILAGPWAAFIAVSVALAIQALLFGDGGILAMGANCLNMAFAMPFAGYYVFRLIARRSEAGSKRWLTAAFIGSYTGLNIAALLTALELGIQPLLFKTSGGVPEYGFYPLSVAVPVIMLEHLLVAGIIEGLVTSAALGYVVKFSPGLLVNPLQVRTALPPLSSRPGLKRPWGPGDYKPLMVGLGVLVLLSPLGLVATGTAFGEWDSKQIKSMLGYVPSGIERLSGLWRSFFQDYSLPWLKDGLLGTSAGYIISALVGIAAISAVMIISGRFISRKDGDG